MLISRRLPQALAAAVACVGVCVSLSLSPPAWAGPITVNLRVEGSAKTLFEGPVSAEAVTEPPGLTTRSSGGAHPCDVKDNGSNGGFGTASATPTTALYAAAIQSGLGIDASWSTSLNDFDITQIGSDIANSNENGEFWGYAVNYTTANVGGCQFQLAPGGEVLWAYNYFELKHLLAVSGPTAVNAGMPFTVHVTDGQTGEPISGAAIGEVTGGVTTSIPAAPLTDASGNATISRAQAGSLTLKATRADSVRSNGLAVCVHAGNDGSCGTTAPAASGSSTAPASSQAPPQPAAADLAKVLGVRNGHVYPRRFAPRVLSGIVEIPAGGTLRQVRIRLERRYRGRCFDFSGARERFVRARRCGAASFFSVGSSESFSYLLPAPLPAGRYAYDIEAVDSTGHATKLIGGVSHVVFGVV
jgi:hypothetical protein